MYYKHNLDFEYPERSDEHMLKVNYKKKGINDMGKVGIEAITEVVDNMLIGIEGIVQVLDDFLEEFELKAVPSTDFYYQQDTNEIGFALAVSDFTSTQFQQYVCRLCP